MRISGACKAGNYFLVLVLVVSCPSALSGSSVPCLVATSWTPALIVLYLLFWVGNEVLVIGLRTTVVLVHSCEKGVCCYVPVLQVLPSRLGLVVVVQSLSSPKNESH
jgi:hypothetical protein